MAILSNTYCFPLLQLTLLALLVFALWRDYRPRMSGGVGASMVVTRVPETMSMLAKTTGLVIAAIITVVNKSVFDDVDADWRHYSAIFNLFDLCAIVYLCYVSPFGRSLIIGLNNRLKEERR